MEQQPPPLEERQRNVVSRHRGAAFIFNAAAMLCNAHTICVTLRVNNRHFPIGDAGQGGKGKWGSINSHSHHFFGRCRPLMVSPRGFFLLLLVCFVCWQGVCDSQIRARGKIQRIILTFFVKYFHLLHPRPQTLDLLCLMTVNQLDDRQEQLLPLRGQLLRVSTSPPH